MAMVKQLNSRREATKAIHACVRRTDSIFSSIAYHTLSAVHVVEHVMSSKRNLQRYNNVQRIKLGPHHQQRILLLAGVQQRAVLMIHIRMFTNKDFFLLVWSVMNSWLRGPMR